MKGKFVKKAAAIAVAVSLTAASLAGCSTSSEETQAQSQSQEETGAGESETETEAVTENDPVDPEAVALEIDDMKIMAPELFYFYLSMRTQMEYSYQTLGSIDWTVPMYDGGPSYGDYLKSMVESQLLQILFWNTYAQEDNITLSDDDQEQITEELAAFNEALTDEDKACYGFNDDNVTQTLEHISIAGKAMDAEVEKQIAQFTDEEKEQCVYRTVQHILFKTTVDTETDESGNAETVSAEEEESYKESQKAKAEEVLARAQAGEDFETLADEYNEDSGFEYSLNSSGQSPAGVSYVQEFTDGAFALSEGEVAIVETEYGYHVMKCISENDEALGEEASRTLAVNKYNDIYQQWLTDNAPEFYDGWTNYVVLNTPALPSQAESEGESLEADESQSTGDTQAADDTQATDETQTADDTQSTDDTETVSES